MRRLQRPDRRGGIQLLHLSAVWAEGKHIRTLEGLLGPNGELSDIQQAFVDEAAIQCGFCTPGFYPDGSGDPGERQGVHGR